MPVSGFKELVLTTFPVKKAACVFRTSGTTRGLKGAHFFETLRFYDAAILPSFRKYLLPDGASLSYFFLTESPRNAPHSSLSYMMGVVDRRFAAKKGRFYVDKGNLRSEQLFRDLGALGSSRKAILLSTAFSLKAFLDHLIARKARLALAPGSRIMETGGFKGKVKEVSRAVLYSLCQKWLGIPKSHIVSEYGMTELSSQFYDTTLYDEVRRVRRKPFKEGPPWMRTLVIDPRTGREAKKGGRGVLRHFDLANVGSVMAVQTEDMGRAVGEGFELLGRVPGADLRGCSLTYEEFLNAR